ncbi:MAG: 50S ribosomal protein L15 [Candidatus Omnitrophota bacterium]
MRIGNIRAPKGARRKKKLLGRGPGSGHGKTSTRGQKGQRARSGEGKRPGFEGGQMPLIKRIPKRGFTNPFKKIFEVVNLGKLDGFAENTAVTPQLLLEKDIIDKADNVKILGDGEINKPLTVCAHSFSGSAKEKIEKAGGKIQII